MVIPVRIIQAIRVIGFMGHQPCATNLSSTLKKTAKSKIRKTVNAGKKLQVSKKENLEILEKLAKLKESGIITAKEFQEKKKKILSDI